MNAIIMKYSIVNTYYFQWFWPLCGKLIYVYAFNMQGALIPQVIFISMILIVAIHV